MARQMKLKKSYAPKKPPQIIMIGPPGVNLGEHAEHIASQYNVCNVVPGDLIDEYIKEEKEGFNELKQYLKLK